MSDAFIGEILSFAGNYAPDASFAWKRCDGQTIPIAGNEALYSLIGTSFGGDGSTNFALPNLNGRLPLGQGNTRDGLNYIVASSGGSETVLLTTAQMPQHSHTLYASAAEGTTNKPSPAVTFAAVPNTDALYVDTTKTIQPKPVAFSAASISQTGPQTPHANMMPSIAITYLIATQGNFPGFD